MQSEERLQMRYAVSLCLLLFLPSVVCASPADQQFIRREHEPANHSEILPAGTPIMLQMMQTVTTEGDSWRAGDTFTLQVLEDVSIGEQVVIPNGTLAFGHVRWSTGRGAFGKSGKIEVEIDHLMLGGKEVQLTGIHRRSGSGGITSAGSAVAAGLLAPFITGKSGEIAQGSAVQAFLAQDLRVALSGHRQLAHVEGGARPAVRARQISVREAFRVDDLKQSHNPSREVPELRETVAQAFENEIRSLKLRP